MLIDAALQLTAEGVEVSSVRPRSPELTRDNAEPVALTGRRLTDAAEQGLLRSADLKRIQIAGRALVHGFAQMNLDGHLPRWCVEENEIERVAEGVLDLSIAGVAKP
ncbi:MAG: TetR-like C-terminal domain-containing protein [Bradyrhizobium sp.]|uniref:TetR-like C-terminal domain-containing protein n=1 Tax=Bradyrhizobium sp. TaxID=376 RepID=UPI0029A91429|nr:TetR-like C-terminal domain-containing protein [Bradyrhizobium sp.]MDX3966733.1 TetR-like C-terminal domain-containing protein [Bradyrhizobium sp.]